jgi:hypothetical protein
MAAGDAPQATTKARPVMPSELPAASGTHADGAAPLNTPGPCGQPEDLDGPVRPGRPEPSTGIPQASDLIR